MNAEAERLVRDLDLTAHPEGGYFRETFRSEPESGRAALSSIFFLLPRGEFSAFHTIDADEAWHHHAGDDVALHVLLADGGYECHALGRRGPWQTVVSRGDWFAAEVLASPAGYALVGCDVAPAFSFAGFALAEREALVTAHPERTALVMRLTRTERVARG